ncbi:hypothetical protein [uncultured Thiodictyon sp.]|uniref:hypothetical protein n=1 Tax=uncultured Thiodictyon sp. TaxID=1846217 RepID=UPI003458AB9C
MGEALLDFIMAEDLDHWLQGRSGRPEQKPGPCDQASLNGFSNPIPQCSKSRVLRVTRVS